MYTLIALLYFAGFYLFYLTSKMTKRPLPASSLTKRLATRPTAAKWAGCALFLAGWALLAFMMGWGAGTFAVLAYVMCMGSLVVLLAPLGVIGLRQLLLLIALGLFVEFLIR